MAAEQNDSQSEEINVTDESQAEKTGPYSCRKMKKDEKVSLVGHFLCCA